jgi:hypothetical protein
VHQSVARAWFHIKIPKNLRSGELCFLEGVKWLPGSLKWDVCFRGSAGRSDYGESSVCSSRF